MNSFKELLDLYLNVQSSIILDSRGDGFNTAAYTSLRNIFKDRGYQDFDPVPPEIWKDVLEDLATAMDEALYDSKKNT